MADSFFCQITSAVEILWWVLFVSQLQKLYLVPFCNFCPFIVTLCWKSVLFISFGSLYTVSFGSLGIFKTVDLESLSNKPIVSAYPETVFITFFLWMGHTFSFLCMPYNFWLKTRHCEYYDVFTLKIRLFCSAEFVVLGL